MSYEMISSRLCTVLDYCRGPLKLAKVVDDSRFVETQRRLARVVAVVQAIKAGTATVADMSRITAELLDNTVALAEAYEIGATADFVVTRDRREIGRTMRKILDGPRMPSDEDTASNQSRNTLFEIVVASTLAKAGLDASLGEPDVRIASPDGSVYIACKRIFSRRSLRDRIDDAGGQIARRLIDDPSAIGIIAISLSRLLNASREAIQVPNQGAAQQGLIQWIEQTVSDAVGGLDIRETGAQALLFHASSPFSNLEMSRFDWGEQYVGWGVHPRLRPITDALDRFAGRAS